MKVFLIFGTRPEAIKMAPVALEANRRKGVDLKIVNTGQHREMVAQMMSIFGLQASYDLQLMTPGQTPDRIFARAVEGIGKLLERDRPDWVLVQGDTTTAAAAALAGFYHRIRVGHVEAGLRTHDLSAPWPEEYNRRIITLSSHIHFAPTQEAVSNLLAEKVPQHQVVLTGNTGIDALFLMLERLRGPAGARFAERWAFLKKPLVLCTLHRREAFGPAMEGVMRAVRRIAESGKAEIVLPLHPNPAVRSAATKVFGEASIQGLHLVDPLDYPEFLYLMDRSILLLTDSGEVQEEAPSIGKPVVVTRDKTERPEAVQAGAAVLAGTDPDRIEKEVRRILGDESVRAKMATPRPLFGDGKASVRILDAIQT